MKTKIQARTTKTREGSKAAMDRPSRDNRHYTTSVLPSLQEKVAIAQPMELQLKLYEQVCSTWKELVSIRFKLLGLVPTVSIALLAVVLSTMGLSAGLTLLSKLLICLFGFVATFALFVYDHRNSELHDDLISRGRKLEEELGIDTGIFRGRLKASGIFKHDVATNLIYYSSLLAWVFAIVLITSVL